MDINFLRKLRILGVVEGISTLLLFGVAMPLKYMAGMPMAVTIVGSIHGLLFVALVAMFLVGMRRIPLTTGLTACGIFGAVVPFGPFVVDHWLGRLEAVPAAPGQGRSI
jgi:integral membrane protein